MRPLSTALACLALSGCATSLGAAHDAKVLDRGRVELHLGTGVLVPAGVIGTVLSAGKDKLEQFARDSESTQKLEVHDSEARTAVAALALMLVSPPAPVTDLDLRYGVYDRLELGLRKSGPSWRLEGWGQILDEDWKVSGGLGVGTATFDDGILGLAAKYDLLTFGRFDLDATVLAGKNYEYGSFYFGPKVAYSSFSGEGLLINGKEITVVTPTGQTGALSLELGSSLIAGALVGGRVGWKYVWLTAELGVFHSSFAPVIEHQEVDLGGLVVYPSVGIVGRY